MKYNLSEEGTVEIEDVVVIFRKFKWSWPGSLLVNIELKYIDMNSDAIELGSSV